MSVQGIKAKAPKGVKMPSNDIQRIGLFSEVGYITIGDPYRTIVDRPFNDSASRGKQMMSCATKSKTGLGDGYFTVSLQNCTTTSWAI